MAHAIEASADHILLNEEGKSAVSPVEPVLDDNGDVRPAADFIDAAGEFTDVPDAPIVGVYKPEAVASIQDPALTQRQQEQALWDKRYDELYDELDRNYASPDHIRSEIEKRIGERPRDYVTKAMVETAWQAEWQQEFAVAEAIEDPIERRDKKQALIRKKASHERNTRDAGPVRHH